MALWVVRQNHKLASQNFNPVLSNFCQAYANFCSFTGLFECMEKLIRQCEVNKVAKFVGGREGGQ